MIENIIWFVVPPLIFIGGVVGFIYMALQFALIVPPVGVVEAEGQLVGSELIQEYDSEAKQYRARKELTIRYSDTRGQIRTLILDQGIPWITELPRGILKVRYFAFAPSLARIAQPMPFRMLESGGVGLLMLVAFVVASVTGQWLVGRWGATVLNMFGIR